MSYVNYMSHVNNMSYACRLYELHELCKLYGYFYESLKINCFLFLNYKKENIERKFRKKMPKNQFLKVQNCLLDEEKDLRELKDKELKDREVKDREIEKLLFQPSIVSIDAMDKF